MCLYSCLAIFALIIVTHSCFLLLFEISPFLRFAVAAFLTIGIPSVRRETPYLTHTLDDIIANSRAEHRVGVIVVIFLADSSVSYNAMVRNHLLKKYAEHLTSGFFRILQVDHSYYPLLENLKQNFNDTAVRTRWRSKQVADYALLFAYARNLSEYYMQLEDDVISAPDFLVRIRDKLRGRLRNNKWVVLDFCKLGFIGRVIRCRDLQQLSNFMLIFYQEQPVDWLISVYMNAMGQKKRIGFRPSLFQHIGNVSSLEGKGQFLRDKTFGRSRPTHQRMHQHTNPMV